MGWNDHTMSAGYEQEYEPEDNFSSCPRCKKYFNNDAFEFYTIGEDTFRECPDCKWRVKAS